MSSALQTEYTVQPGQRFGYWTVLDTYLKTQKGERKWLCRCQCGTQRHVLERTLKSGGSLSCGCMRKENARASTAYDLTGHTFGALRVLRKADDQSRSGGVWWECECSCGQHYEAPATLLVTGKRTHCGGKAHQKKYAYTDITGQRFHRLVALFPTPQRDAKGSVMWHCRCDCGNELDIPYNNLKYSETKSCGCRKKEHEQKLNTYLTHVDGTSIDMLKSQKVPANNTTGAKGVYLVRGRYLAKIVFQKTQYYLGTYDSFEDALEARREAESLLNQTIVAHHEAWSAAAAADPAWAAENPIQFIVTQNCDKKLQVCCLPSLVCRPAVKA